MNNVSENYKVVIAFFIVLSLIVIAWGFGRKDGLKYADSNYKIKIKECFEDVDWTRYKWVNNGVTLTEDGEDRFYKATSIDEAIKKFNNIKKEGK